MWLTRMLLIITLLIAATATSRSAELDAAKLAERIDRLLDDRLKSERIAPAKPAEDAEFVRRVYLDLHGVIPTSEQTTRFLAD